MSPRPFTAASALFALALAPAAQDALAEYEVVFTAAWSSTTHPTDFPPNPHFSPLIGGTHSDQVSFWEPGGIATQGIEVMAESGGTGALTGELNAAIFAGTAGELITGSGSGSPGSVTTTFTVTEEHPQVSLVTMIAPSPDWFIGVHGLDLREGCEWIPQVTVDLFAYDAGTDSGPNFLSGNQDTNPHEPISLITGGPFFGTVPLGTFTFTRKGAVDPYGCGINPDGSLTFDDIPEVGSSWDLEIHDPTGTMPLGSVTVVTASALAVPTLPCGCAMEVAGLGLGGPTGEILLPVPALTLVGSPWAGGPVPMSFPIPPTPTLAGQSAIVQGGLVDPITLKIGLTQGMRAWIAN